MSHYKPYPAYKDSGVEWLGRVPEHWEITPLKYLIAGIESGTSVNATDTPAGGGELGVLKTSCVYSGKFDPAENKAIVPEEYGRATCPLVAGSLIVSRMNTPDLVGAAGLVCHALDGIFLPDRLWQVSFSGVMPLFAYYWSQSGSYRAQVKMVCTGTSSSMQNLSQDQFKDFLLGVPAEDEQQLIAAHLDLETARIDALVEKKTRFIELLREKRQALITHAVTKGLDPNVKMKDSGVEWLGEVPEHWQALPLRRVVTAVKTGGTPSEEQPSPDADGLAWYTPGDFGNSLVLSASEKRVSALAVSTGEAKVYPVGAVLVVSIGATLGKVGYLVESASANQQINAVIPSSRVSGYFLAYSLSVKTEAMWFLANAATIGIMNQEKTKEIWLAVPSPSEQKAITDYLDKGTGRIDSLIGKTEHSITLLKERRSALITAAVTGQIDLREAACH